MMFTTFQILGNARIVGVNQGCRGLEQHSHTFCFKM